MKTKWILLVDNHSLLVMAVTSIKFNDDWIVENKGIGCLYVKKSHHHQYCNWQLLDFQPTVWRNFMFWRTHNLNPVKTPDMVEQFSHEKSQFPFNACGGLSYKDRDLAQVRVSNMIAGTILVA